MSAPRCSVRWPWLVGPFRCTGGGWPNCHGGKHRWYLIIWWRS